MPITATAEVLFHILKCEQIKILYNSILLFTR
nr:MAG TPA: hypothetical protein [Caudoviricetes sp.]